MEMNSQIPRRNRATRLGTLGLRWHWVFVAMFVGMIGMLAAETMPPKPDRYFNDYASVVDPATASQLNEELAQFERDTSTQILVAIYRSMESESSVDDYTQRIAQTWGVGQKGHNNGAVLFVFVADHRMFIQTGYGLEGALPDATCFDITHNVIAPLFKKNDYAGGLKAGVAAMMQAVRGEYKGSGRTHKEGDASSNGPGLPIGLIIFLIILFFIIMSRRKRTGRRGYGYTGWGGPYVGGFGGGGWSGGSGSGAGGGFSGFSGGGGSFGGGGAGSSW